MHSTIPATEVQLRTMRLIPGGPPQAVVATKTDDSTKIEATKNDGGMHLVFRNISEIGNPGDPPEPAIRVIFPNAQAAGTALLPLCGSTSFLEEGFAIPPGEWVTLSVKPTIGLEGSAYFKLPFDVLIDGDPPPQSGRPSEPAILIHC